MIDQLKELGVEMVQEIKNLKDLTKETLPEVAKEYVKFHTTIYLMFFIFFGIITLICAGLIIHGLINNLFTDQNIRPLQIFAVVGIMLSGFFGGMSLFSFLEFYYQPRTKAIEGVVKAFRGEI